MERNGLPPELPKLRTEADLQRRMAELRRHYEPFTRNLNEPLTYRVASEPLNPWRFRYSGQETWQEISLPEYKGRGYWEGEYECKLELPEALKQKPRLAVRFEGVDTTLEARLNRQEIGYHRGADEPFELDITGCVNRDGANTLHLYVRHGITPNPMGYRAAFSLPPFKEEHEFYKLTGEWGNLYSRMGHAGGVWRPVRLVGTGDTWVEWALIDPLPERSQVRIRVHLASRASGTIEVGIQVLGKNSRETKPLPFRQTVEVQQGEAEVTAAIDIPDQRWWTLEEPYLYTARVTLAVAGTVVDGKDFTFGQRTFRYDPESRFYRLNGKPFRFRGTATINSLNMAYLRGDDQFIVDHILLAKAASFNILRHHILSPIAEIDEYMDMYGMLVQAEMPIWARFQPELVEQALEALPRIVRQHYSHPSTAMFSLSSESPYELDFFCDYQQRAIEVMERDFPGLEWKVEGATGNHLDARRPTGLYQEDLFDSHEYAGWYVNLGALEPVRDGKSLMTTGEFGPESLSNLSTMQKCWPAGTYPADPDAPVSLQELPFGPQYKGEVQGRRGDTINRWLLPSPRTLRGWIEATQEHSAFVHRYQTDIFRRSPSVIGYHQYFLNEPVWNTHRKTLCGVDLSPKRPYFVMAEANQPVRLSIFSDQDHYAPGDRLACQVYLANDGEGDIESAVLRYYFLSPDGGIMAQGEETASAQLGIPRRIADLQMDVPGTWSPGEYAGRAFLLGHDGATLADYEWRFRVLDPAGYDVARIQPAVDLAHYAGSAESLQVGRYLAERVPGYHAYPLAEIAHRLSWNTAPLIVLDTVPEWDAIETALLRDFVRGGGALLLRELEPGSLAWLHQDLTIKFDPQQVVFRPDCHHPIFRGLTPEDFRMWSFVPLRGPITPKRAHEYVCKRSRDLVESAVVFGGRVFDRTAYHVGDGQMELYSIADAQRQASALLEIRLGRGIVLISQARCFERYASHPLARLLYCREIEYLTTREEPSRAKFDTLGTL